MSLLIIEHSDLTGSDRLGERLQRDGHKLHIVRVHRGEQLPPDLDEIHGVISCGGPQSPDCDEPWMEQELHLLRGADALDLPVLGLCLGCQLLAKALGGSVSKSNTPEIGWFDIDLTPEGRMHVMFGGQPWCSSQFLWHCWEVTTLPEHATILASSEQCKVQAWTRGINTYGVQFHPECEKETIATWIADDTALLSDLGIEPSTIDSDTKAKFDDYERFADRFFDLISHLLMPVHTRLAKQRH